MAMKSWGGIHRRPGVLVRGLAGAGLVMILAVGMPARMSRAQEEGPRVELSSQPAPTEPEAPTTTPTSSPAPVPGKTQKTHASLSPLGMFLGADPVVQGVMALLALASVVTWTVLLVRAVALLLAKRRLRRAIARIRKAESLAAAGEAVQRGLPAQFLVAVAQEVARSAGLPSEGIKDRAQVGLGRIEAAAAKRAAAGTGILATIGSTGPFVGLFGTVWGIMHSFIGIAESHTTNLSVVAPGIAEALLATGIGLVAAIPAVVIYNALTRSVAAYRALMSDAVALILCHLSRDLDRRATGLGAPYASLSIAAE